MGEAITLEVPVSNPLALDLHLSGLELVFEHSSGAQCNGEDAVQVWQSIRGSIPSPSSLLVFFFSPFFLTRHPLPIKALIVLCCPFPCSCACKLSLEKRHPHGEECILPVFWQLATSYLRDGRVRVFCWKGGGECTGLIK